MWGHRMHERFHQKFGGHHASHDHRDCGPRGGHGSFRRGPFEVSWSFDRGEGGPGSGFGGGRGGGRGRRMFDSGELRLVLLKLIADSPRHGYDLIRAIEELTGGAYAPSPGVIYPTVTMLDDMGLIAEQKAEGARKAYAVTAEGTAHLAENAETVTALFERLAHLAERQQRADGGPIRRAMGNLKMALHQRLDREEADADVLHDIAEIIDEAVRKIERLGSDRA